MSMFATRGHAQAAGEAVLEAMREISVCCSGLDQPNDQMKSVARDTFRKLPEGRERPIDRSSA